MENSDHKRQKMICSICSLPIDDPEGVTNVNKCDHFICRKCLTTLVQDANREVLTCPTNKGKENIICSGYLDPDDIKDVSQFKLIPEKVYEDTREKVDNEPKPSTSKGFSVPKSDTHCNAKDSSSCNYDTDDDLDFEKDSSVGNPQKVEESNPSPEKKKDDGWDQMVSYFNELMKTESLNFYDASAHVDEMRIWTTTKPSRCPICEEESIPPGESIILKDCFHIFCRSCIVQHIEHSSEVCEVPCPFSESEYSCPSCLKPNELRTLTSQEVYERHYIELSLRDAARNLTNVFHCLTPDCKGFCVFERIPSGIFECPICEARSCLSCKVIHLQTCAEYWQQIDDEEERLRQLQQQGQVQNKEDSFDLRNRLEQRKNEEMSENMIKKNLDQNVFMRCPSCKIPCYKMGGCPEVTCGACKRCFLWAGINDLDDLW